MFKIFSGLFFILIIGINFTTQAQETTSSMKGLRTTIYKVENIETAKQWYARAFNTEPYFDQSFYVGFNIGGYELGLQPDSTKPEAKTNKVVAYWGVDNIQETYDFLISIGASDNEQPVNVGGNIMTATVLDPWGNIIGIIYNPDFKVIGE